jgi:hypothetical protein
MLLHKLVFSVSASPLDAFTPAKPKEQETLNNRALALRQRFDSMASWAKSFFTPDADGRLVCEESSCTKAYSKDTSSSALVKHLCTKHKKTVPSYLEEKVKCVQEGTREKKQLSVVTMFAQKDNAVAVQKELVVVAYCMNCVSFLTLSNVYWKAAFQKSLEGTGLDRDTIPLAIRQYAGELATKFQGYCKNNVVSLAFDGAKDISGNKLLGSNLILGATAYMLDLFNTNAEYLDTDYFSEYLKGLVNKVAGFGAVAISVTVDNEPSVNAGVNHAISNKPELSYLLHFRCGCHAVELMIKECAHAIPDLQAQH